MSPSNATLAWPAHSATAPPVRDERPKRPRVWLVGRSGNTAEPTDLPAVRDTAMRTWVPDVNGIYHSADGWHHITWAELRSRADLVEVA